MWETEGFKEFSVTWIEIGQGVQSFVCGWADTMTFCHISLCIQAGYSGVCYCHQGRAQSPLEGQNALAEADSEWGCGRHSMKELTVLQHKL